MEWMMSAFDVIDLSALEILDSRGRPTLAVTVRLADGTTGPGRGAVRRLDWFTRSRGTPRRRP